jgi:hypothetical protein
MKVFRLAIPPLSLLSVWGFLIFCLLVYVWIVSEDEQKAILDSGESGNPTS